MMTNMQRKALEDRILAYGDARSDRSFAQSGGNERQEALAACREADAWDEVQDAIDALDAELERV